MKRETITKTILSLALGLTITTACNEEDLPVTMNGLKSLEINVTAQTPTKAIMESEAFPNGEQYAIGLALVDDSDATYDGNNYANVKSVPNEDNDKQVWTKEKDMLLSSTEGTLYGYYPYSNTVADITQIPVTAGETDYMYATPVTGLTDKKHKANVIMNHALAAIRLNIVRGTYTETGEVTKVTIASGNMATSAKMNAKTGVLNEFSGIGETIEHEETFTLTTTPKQIDKIFIPYANAAGEGGEEPLAETRATATAPTFTVTVDGKDYAAIPDEIIFQQGSIYQYTLTLNGELLQVTESGIDNWGTGNTEELEMKASYFTAIYDVTTTSEATQIMGSQFNIGQVNKMYIDGVEVSPTATYTFSTTGEHTVKCTFKEGALTSCERMFDNCLDLIEIDVTNLDTSEVTTMLCMFRTNVGTEMRLQSLKGNLNTSKVTSMAGMFQCCSNLTTLNTNNWDTSNVLEIHYMFYNCSSLESIDISNWDVKNISNSTCMFYGCIELTTVELPENMTLISIDCFALNKKLSNITIPESVTRIEEEAFHSCSSLTSINIPDGVTNIGDRAFYACKSLNIELLSLPEGLKSIGEMAFINCKKIKSVQFPSTLESIGLMAFGWCEEMSGTITIPKGVISIGDGPFMTTNVTTFEVEEGNANYKTDDVGSCILSMDGKRLVQARTNTIIPDGVEVIGQAAFQRTAITKITIPESVNTLSGYVFGFCSGLTKIYALPTEAPVFSIEKDSFSGIGTNGTLYVPMGCKDNYTSWMQVLEPLGWTIKEIIPNGVYAVGADGSPVMKEDADESCIAVALITDNQKIMIAKENATDGTNTTLYWGKNLDGYNVAGITDISSEEVAETDFKGKANTAAIIAAYTEHGVEMNSRDMCKVLQDLNMAEEADWYIPACGQLCEMYQNKAAIEEMLTVIGGTNFSSSGYYWSSTETDIGFGWKVTFDDYSQEVKEGTIHEDKTKYHFVRFVQDLKW